MGFNDPTATPPGGYAPPEPPTPEFGNVENSVREDVEGKAEFRTHLLSAAENASRDTDSLVSKIATAGITATLAIAGLAGAAPASLVAAGFFFAGSLIVSLVSMRVSADALRLHASKYPERPSRTYLAIVVANYLALALLVIAVMLAAFAVSSVAVPPATPSTLPV